MNTFYERIDDGELFVYDEENKTFYSQEMKKFKDKGHLINEYSEETLDFYVKRGVLKKHTKNPVVIAQHDVITDLILENKKLKEEIAQLKKKMIPKKYATYQNTKVGDKIMFRESTMHWFTNRIENAKKLVSGQVYTVKKISVASSSTGVILEETNEEVELTWFDIIED